MSWEQVDEGWGRKAADFASILEPACCREYLDVHHRLSLGAGDRLLDVACGSGLSIELASIRGADCAGIDASERLTAVARDRSPAADIRVGDMNDMPWADETFDVVTSFRGLWGTTPAAFDEAHRVLRPGGRLALTVWGDIKNSSGVWAMAPLILAAEDKVQNQADMNALGKPGVCEQFLSDHGFGPETRFRIPFALEFPDPDTFARGLAAVGPAYEAIENVGEDAFLEASRAGAEPWIREGLPLRAEIEVFGYIGHKR